MPASFAVGWRQVCAAFMLLAATGMVAPTYSIVAVPLGQEFHPTRTVLMLTMTVMSACSPIAETGGVGSSGRTDRALNRAGQVPF